MKYILLSILLISSTPAIASWWWNPANPKYYILGPGANQENEQNSPAVQPIPQEQQDLTPIILTIVFFSILALAIIIIQTKKRAKPKLKIEGASYCSNCKNYTAFVTSSQVRDHSYVINYHCKHCDYSGVHANGTGWVKDEISMVKPVTSNPRWE